MKNILRIAALLLAAAVAPFAHAGTFGGEKFVSSDASLPGQFPQIAFHNGVVHVVFVAYPPSTPGIGHVYYARSTSALGNFSAPVNLSSGVSPMVDRTVVTAGANGVVVGWHSSGSTGAAYVRRSGDGGLTFGAAQVLHGAEGDGFYSRVTSLFTDSLNNVHATYYTNADNAGVSGMIHHRMSCDGGQTWSGDQAITSQAVDGEIDFEQPRVSEAGGKLYLIYKSSRYGNPQGGWPPYTIEMHSGTRSGCGVAWSFPARRVGGGVPFTRSTTFDPDLYGDSTGTLHLAWQENTFGTNVHYRKGTLNTGPLGAAARVSNFDANHMEPGSVSTTGGIQQPVPIVSNGATAFIAYSRNTTSTNNLEQGAVLLRESSNNGTTWGPEQNISTAGTGVGPRLAIDNANTNNVGIVWTEIVSGTIARVKYRLYTLGALSGGPSLSFAPDPLAFGDRQVGAPVALGVTVTNTGSAGTISSVAISDPLSTDYTKTGDTCTGAIAGGASCTVQVTFTPQALGSRPATLVVTSDAVDSPNNLSISGNGIPNAGDAQANIAAVVTGYYETILGRSPDAGGKTFWISEANRVATLGANIRETFFTLSITFFTSPEYVVRNTSDAQYVTDLYRTFFSREPDSGGLTFWTGYLTQGVDRGALLTNFLFSPEFNAVMVSLFGTTNVRAEIDMTMDFFRGILGRLPDDGGFVFWRDQLRAAQCQGAGAVTAKANELSGLFIGSGEYASREAARPAPDRTRMYVGDLYNAFLRRGAEPNGYNFWVGQMTSGARTRDDVRVAFVTSPEFQNRVTNVVNAGCQP